MSACALVVAACCFPALSLADPPAPLSSAQRLALAVESVAAGDDDHAEQHLKILGKAASPWSERAALLRSRIAAGHGRWNQALYLSEQALPGLSVIGDYVLFDRAGILQRLGRKEEAVETLRRLRSTYPTSPLMYDVRILEAELRVELYASDEALTVLDPLLAQRDLQAMMLAVEGYRKRGLPDRAESLCRWMYLNRPATAAGRRAEAELRAMGRFGFSREEELLRADNLVDAGQTNEAERIYRLWLSRGPVDRRLWERLGVCLFRGRRYEEAAVALRNADGLDAAFLELRSRYRAGMTPEETIEGIDQLLLRYPAADSRLYALRLEVARDLRRLGQTSRAVDLLKKLELKYPGQQSVTRWELAWTYFRHGDLETAAKVLRNIRISDGMKERPRYWTARILEAQGKLEANRLYQSLIEARDSGYYGFLATGRISDASIPAAVADPPPQQQAEEASPVFPGFLRGRDGMERIQELRVLGMFEEACAELPFLSRGIKKREEILAVAHLCTELGDYHRAITLAQQLGRFHDTVLGLAYPRGFWPLVVKAAQREGLDPYLVAAVIREESHFREEVVSSAGAVGLMQVLPATALRNHEGAGVDTPTASKLKTAEFNIPVGVHYLGRLLRRYDGDVVRSIAAYNAGERAVDRWLSELGETPADVFAEEIPYRETRHYVRKVLASYRMYRQVWGQPPLSGVTFARTYAARTNQLKE